MEASINTFEFQVLVYFCSFYFGSINLFLLALFFLLNHVTIYVIFQRPIEAKEGGLLLFCLIFGYEASDAKQ